MKRIYYIIYASIIILLVPFPTASGQDKKSEQKVKVVVNDGSGKKIVIDTVFYNSPGPDSIKLKDGTVVYMKHPGDGRDFKHHPGKNHIVITASSDGEDNGKEFKDITVIASDSLDYKVVGDSNNVVYYSKSDSREGRGGGKYKVITRKSDGRSENNEIIYVNKGKHNDKEIEKTIDVFVSDDEGDTETEKSRYVIAKDGMVITIEGNDDAKAKELAKEIEEKLGVKNDATEKKETVKVESKKAIKK